MGRLNRKVLRRGISELVVVLIIVVIAVVAGLGLRYWVSSQMAKTPTTEMATAEWSATYGGNLWIITIRVKNNLDRAIWINATTIIMNDGSTPSYTLRTPTSLPVSLGPKSDTQIILTVSAPSTNPPKTVRVLVTDSVTRATSDITAVGGVQY